MSPSQADYAQLDVPTSLPRAVRHYHPRQLGKLDFDQLPVNAATGISAEQGYYSRQAYHAEGSRAFSLALTLPLGAIGLHRGQLRARRLLGVLRLRCLGNKLVMTIECNGQNLA